MIPQNHPKILTVIDKRLVKLEPM